MANIIIKDAEKEKQFICYSPNALSKASILTASLILFPGREFLEGTSLPYLIVP